MQSQNVFNNKRNVRLFFKRIECVSHPYFVTFNATIFSYHYSLFKTDEVDSREEIEHIIKGCRQNRRKAQKQLYELYCDAMYTTAFRILKNVEEAEDALQEAFLDVFRHISSFRGDSTIGAWIKTIVVRRSLKKLKGLRFTENIDENGSEVPPDYLDDLSGEYLEQMILSLPEGYRTVFLLVEVEGYKHKEAGEMLGISESGSKSQLSRAKQLLRKKIEKINAI